MRVLVIANNLKQASFRLRIDALRDALARRNIFLDVQLRSRRMLARRRLLRSASNYDAVILQRKLLDPMDARILRRHAKKIFYDVDDAVMFHNRSVSALARWRTTRRFVAIARRIDLAVTGNEYLAALFRRQGAEAIVLPTVVDPSHYQLKSHVKLAPAVAPPTGTVRLVWIGSRSTLPYLARSIPIIKQAAARVPGLRLLIIADATLKDPAQSGPILPIDHVLWSESTEAAALIQGDIGIAPTPEDRWTLGKCGFKIIQYMAAGLPVIASPVGANAQIVVPGETGFLPEEAADWLEAIVKLAGDVELRAKMGAAGRARVEKYYSVDHAAEMWAGLLAGTPVGKAVAI
jgi:glycosyltransferase involved in cell wall biosynthesis